MQETGDREEGVPRVRRGRPRDPAIDTRVMDAALKLYGRVGWSGFNLDAVARASKVSKDALYRRWRTREALMADALKSRWTWVASIDNGNIRDDLLNLASQTFDTFAGVYGEVALQLRADTRRLVEVRAYVEPYRATMAQQARAIMRRAIRRGEIPPSVNPGLVIDLVVGSVINRIVSTPDRLRETMLEQGPAFIQIMVDVVLAGLSKARQD